MLCATIAELLLNATATQWYQVAAVSVCSLAYEQLQLADSALPFSAETMEAQ